MGATDQGTRDPRWEQTPDARLLALVADVDGDGADDSAVFLAACEADAAENDGMVSVNRVPHVLARAGAVIESHRYSALWKEHTGPDQAMCSRGWEIRSGSATRNDGKPIRIREWVGANPDAPDDHVSATEAA